MNQEVVILSAARTPIGSFLGSLKHLKAPKLGAITIEEALKRSHIPRELVDECLMGCVLTAGVGQAPARQATLFAGLPPSVCATTINRVCGSGLKTIMLASQILQCGDARVVIAGGMESMSNSPYLLAKAREGYKMGPEKLIDSMILDGLWDVYHDFHMGNAAELCVKEKSFSREAQDAFSKKSYERAISSIQSKLFEDEIVPVNITPPKSTESLYLSQDEEPMRVNFERFAHLKPVFDKQGTITAANSSSLSDGASALVLTTAKAAQEFVSSYGSKPLARVVAHASFATAPEWFTIAPVGAIQKLLKIANLSIDAIDYFEINEAFAVVALACMKELGLSDERVNIKGGAVALGHPIGASGSRIVTTLLYTLIQKKARYGIATACIGGGEASAILIERCV